MRLGATGWLGDAGRGVLGSGKEAKNRAVGGIGGVEDIKDRAFEN